MEPRLEIDVLVVVALAGYCIADLQCGHHSSPCARLRPMDPNISLDDSPPLNVTCTLSKNYSRAYAANSSSIFFKIWRNGGVGYRTMDEQSVSVLSRRKALLSSSDISENDINISCWVRRDGEEERVAEMHAYVGRAPYKPVIDNVTIDNWESMTITWVIEGFNLCYITNYTAWWKYKDRGTWKKCGPAVEGDEQRRGRCKVDKADIKTYHRLDLLLKVNATNIVGTKSSEVVVKSIQELVKPRKAENVKVMGITSRGAVLSWRSPHYAYSFQYNLTLTCKWQSECPMALHTGNRDDINMTYSITGLHPNTDYEVVIKSRSSEGILWSEATSVSFRTLEDVPSATPPITKNSFWSNLINNTHRDVTIFWKAVPEEFANGIITKYFIREVNFHDNTMRVISSNIPGDGFSYTVKGLRVDTKYLFYVNAATQMGYNENKTAAIEVPKSQKVPAFWDYQFEVQTENSLIVTWEDAKGLEKVTVFWCLDDVQETAKCKEELSWKTFSASATTEGEIRMDEGMRYRQYRFGIAVQLNHAWSGIHWVECIYDDKKPPSRPRQSGAESRWSSSVAFKLMPDCRENPGRPSRYDITFCAYSGKVEGCLAADMTEDCEGEPRSVELPVSKDEKYVLDRLEPDAQYIVNVKSVSTRTLSESVPAQFCVRTSPAGLMERIVSSTTITVVLAVAVVVVVILSIWAIYGLCYRRYCFKDAKKWVRAIEVELPKEDLGSSIGLRKGDRKTAEVIPFMSESEERDEDYIESDETDELLKHKLTIGIGLQENINSGGSGQSSEPTHVLVPDVEIVPSYSDKSAPESGGRDSGVGDSGPSISGIDIVAGLNVNSYQEQSRNETDHLCQTNDIPDSSGGSSSGSKQCENSGLSSGEHIENYPKTTVCDDENEAEESENGDPVDDLSSGISESPNQPPFDDGYSQTEECRVFNIQPETMEPYPKVATVDSGDDPQEGDKTGCDGFTFGEQDLSDNGSSDDEQPGSGIESDARECPPFENPESVIEPYPKTTVNESGELLKNLGDGELEGLYSAENDGSASPPDSGDSFDPYPKARADPDSGHIQMDSGLAPVDSGQSSGHETLADDSDMELSDSGGYAATEASADFNQQPGNDCPYLESAAEDPDSGASACSSGYAPARLHYGFDAIPDDIEPYPKATSPETEEEN